LSEKEVLVYIDGEFHQKSEAKVSVFDHGLLYGDGVFEGIRSYGGVVFKLKEHIDRLYRSARAIMLDIPLTQEEMTEAVLKTLRKNELRDAYIRLLVTRGVGDLGLDPRKCPLPSVIIITVPLLQLYDEEKRRRGMSMIVAWVRKRSNWREHLHRNEWETHYAASFQRTLARNHGRSGQRTSGEDGLFRD